MHTFTYDREQSTTTINLQKRGINKNKILYTHINDVRSYSSCINSQVPREQYANSKKNVVFSRIFQCLFLSSHIQMRKRRRPRFFFFPLFSLHGIYTISWASYPSPRLCYASTKINRQAVFFYFEESCFLTTGYLLFSVEVKWEPTWRQMTTTEWKEKSGI